MNESPSQRPQPGHVVAGPSALSTTIPGIVAAAGVIIVALTKDDMTGSEIVGYILLALGIGGVGIAAPGIRSGGRAMAMLLMASLAVMIGACQSVGPRTALSDAAADTDGAANTLRMDSYSSVLQGVTPTGVLISDDGINQVTGGPHRVAGFIIPRPPGPDGVALEPIKVFLTDPSDTDIARLSVKMPDGTSVDVEGFGADNSAVITAANTQVIAALETQGIITHDQAEVAIGQVKAGADIATALAAIGLRMLAPTGTP